MYVSEKQVQVGTICLLDIIYYRHISEDIATIIRGALTVVTVCICRSTT